MFAGDEVDRGYFPASRAQFWRVSLTAKRWSACITSLPVIDNMSVRHRVLFIDHAGVLGGAELFLLDLAKAYGPAGSVLLLDAGPFQERLHREGVKVELLQAPDAVLGVGRGGKGLAQVLAIPGVVRTACKVARYAKDFDLLFANSQKALVIGAVASWLSRKPLVWYLHDIVTASHFSALNRRLSVILGNRCAARIIANSQASKDAFVAAGGCGEKVAVIYNGIAAGTDESDAAAAAQDVRRELGLMGMPVVAVFSRLAPWKGQFVLLEALPQLPGVHALLVGAPLFGDEVRYEEELKAKARSLGMADRVHFLGFREDIPALLQVADVVAHTSVAPEPFGRVIVEGMLARKPVVATRAGGACEIIEDGVTGRLVTPGSVDELATVLRELLSDREKAEALAQAGYAVAVARFSVEAMLAGIEREIATVVGVGPRDEANAAGGAGVAG